MEVCGVSQPRPCTHAAASWPLGLCFPRAPSCFLAPTGLAGGGEGKPGTQQVPHRVAEAGAHLSLGVNPVSIKGPPLSWQRRDTAVRGSGAACPVGSFRAQSRSRQGSPRAGQGAGQRLSSDRLLWAEQTRVGLRCWPR